MTAKERYNCFWFKSLWRFYYGASDECIGLAEIDDIGTLLKAVP